MGAHNLICTMWLNIKMEQNILAVKLSQDGTFDNNIGACISLLEY